MTLWDDVGVSESAREWRAVGFDLDGTLFDHTGAASDAVRVLVVDLGFEPTPELVAAWFALEAQHFESWRAGRISFAEQRRLRLQHFLELLGAKALQDANDLDEVFDRYLAHYRAAWRAFPGAAAVLADLRSSGIRVGVLTNGTEEQQTDKLAVTGLSSVIDVVCTSEGIGVAKPEKRAFEILAERLGFPISEIAYVGDNPDLDIAASRAAGVAAGLVRHGGAAPVGLMAALRSARL